MIKKISIGCSEYPHTQISISYEEGKEFEELDKLALTITVLENQSKITHKHGSAMFDEACKKMDFKKSDYVTKKFEDIFKKIDAKAVFARYVSDYFKSYWLDGIALPYEK